MAEDPRQCPRGHVVAPCGSKRFFCPAGYRHRHRAARAAGRGTRWHRRRARGPRRPCQGAAAGRPRPYPTGPDQAAHRRAAPTLAAAAYLLRSYPRKSHHHGLTSPLCFDIILFVISFVFCFVFSFLFRCCPFTKYYSSRASVSPINSGVFFSFSSQPKICMRRSELCTIFEPWRVQEAVRGSERFRISRDIMSFMGIKGEDDEKFGFVRITARLASCVEAA